METEKNIKSDVTINVNLGVFMVFARILHNNRDELIENIKQLIGLERKGIIEVDHILNEMQSKAMESMEEYLKLIDINP